MSRDHRKLTAFQLADKMAMDIYYATRTLPPEEKYGLQSQIRRAALSVPTNIVEGCYRSGQKEYLQFLRIALASAAEARYLLSFATRLELVVFEDDICDRVLRTLQALIQSIESGESRKSKAESPSS